eukprot:gene13585-15632_t
MSAQDVVDSGKLSNVIAVVIGIGLAAEALVEALFSLIEYAIIFFQTDEKKMKLSKKYILSKKILTLVFSLGFGIGVGSYVVEDSTQGYALGALGGLISPFAHVLVQAGFQGKEFLKVKVDESAAANPADPLSVVGAIVNPNPVATLMLLLQQLQLVHKPSIPGMPGMPDMPTMPTMPTMPGLPGVAGVAGLAGTLTTPTTPAKGGAEVWDGLV